MLQALSFRPKMERQPACQPSVIIFRKVQSDEMRDLNICGWSIVSRQTGANAFLWEMEERQ